jgi:magnesium-transporting ATPase (P-type)
MTPRDRTIVFFVTLLAFTVEWCSFELLRAPYRPPHDMSTLLGRQEIEAVAFFIVTVGLVWFGFLVWFSKRCQWTRIGIIQFAVFCGLLLVAAALIIKYPVWPVTPLNRILH